MMPVHVRRHMRRRQEGLRFEPGITGRGTIPAGTQDVYLDNIPVAQFRYTFLTPDSVELAWVGVRADYRGKGIGRQVVQRILDDMRQRGARTVYLDATLDARGFWRRVGFEPVPPYRGHPNRMVMRLG